VSLRKNNILSRGRDSIARRNGAVLDLAVTSAGLVFVDGRAGLFPPGVWDDCFTIGARRDDWAAFLDEYGVDYLILDKDRREPLASQAGRHGWSRVAKDKVAVIFRRKP
jgi:hypothetical protein